MRHPITIKALKGMENVIEYALDVRARNTLLPSYAISVT